MSTISDTIKESASEKTSGGRLSLDYFLQQLEKSGKTRD